MQLQWCAALYDVEPPRCALECKVWSSVSCSTVQGRGEGMTIKLTPYWSHYNRLKKGQEKRSPEPDHLVSAPVRNIAANSATAFTGDRVLS